MFQPPKTEGDQKACPARYRTPCRIGLCKLHSRSPMGTAILPATGTRYQCGCGTTANVGRWEFWAQLVRVAGSRGRAAVPTSAGRVTDTPKLPPRSNRRVKGGDALLHHAVYLPRIWPTRTRRGSWACKQAHNFDVGARNSRERAPLRDASATQYQAALRVSDRCPNGTESLRDAKSHERSAPAACPAIGCATYSNFDVLSTANP